MGLGPFNRPQLTLLDERVEIRGTTQREANNETVIRKKAKAPTCSPVHTVPFLSTALGPPVLGPQEDGEEKSALGSRSRVGGHRKGWTFTPAAAPGPSHLQLPQERLGGEGEEASGAQDPGPQRKPSSSPTPTHARAHVRKRRPSHPVTRQRAAPAGSNRAECRGEGSWEGKSA